MLGVIGKIRPLWPQRPSEMKYGDNSKQFIVISWCNLTPTCITGNTLYIDYKLFYFNTVRFLSIFLEILDLGGSEPLLNRSAVISFYCMLILNIWRCVALKTGNLPVEYIHTILFL